MPPHLLRDEPRPPGAPPPGWRDWVLVGVVLAAVVVEGVLRDLPSGTAWTVVLAVLAPGLAWRRTHPLAVFLVTFGVTDLAPLVLEPVGAFSAAFVLVVPYSLVRWGSAREVEVGLVAVVLHLATHWGHLFDGVAVLVVSGGVGAVVRFRERERLRLLDQVKLRERERLARDLHDVVAHHVSAVVIRAQAGRALARLRPEAAVEALEVIEAEASRALADMRGLVRVLRLDPGRAPSPGLSDVEGLASGDAVPAVDVEVAAGEVPAAVGAALYRMAQESVTNARRHARNATLIEVRVGFEGGSVVLRVHDDGEGGPVRATGYGLAGMAERAALLGGTCSAGPDPVCGWTVTAVLPLRGDAG
ncbi:histidine kinase [Actinosynnema sp. NPDC020468]|uniref:sensor histidine kinase n=1 Tax=Actinosynnema sp. NPDC020468 TaxID=3154488 RepID=UPI0033FDE2BA